MNSEDDTLKYLKYFISYEKLKSPDHIISLYAHIYGLVYAVEFLLKETNLESKIIQEPLQKYIKDKLIEEFPELKEIYDNYSKLLKKHQELYERKKAEEDEYKRKAKEKREK